jgi:hypothetical protein
VNLKASGDSGLLIPIRPKLARFHAGDQHGAPLPSGSGKVSVYYSEDAGFDSCRAKPAQFKPNRYHCSA